MKQLFLLSMMMLMASFGAFAQEDTLNSAYGTFSPWANIDETKPASAYTLVTDANVRDKPSTTATTIAKLPIATLVNIEQVTADTLKLNGFRAPWCKVSYTLAGKKQSGYLWGGTLSFVTYVIKDEYDAERNGMTYLVGVANVVDEGKWTIQVRAARNGKEINKTEFVVNADAGFYANIIDHGSLGFDKVKDVFSVNIYYPACGYGNNYYLMALTDNKLSRVLDCSSMSDGGVFYSSEDYILPGDKGGIQDHVMVVSSSAEFEEKQDKDGQYMPIKTKQSMGVKIYKWTGDKLQKIKELK